MKNKIKVTWKHLVGETENFSLENIIFHSFSLLLIIFCFLASFLNLALDLIGPTIICVTTVALHSFVYYLSRFKNKFSLAVILSTIEFNFFLSINFFLNDGLKGPTLILFFAVLFVIISIIPKKLFYYYLLINISVVSILLFIEYNFPNSILDKYQSRQILFLDNYVTYVIVVFIIASGVYYSRASHLNQEKELKKRELELLRLNNQKSRIFSVVSHDLRSPLASVQQYLKLMDNIDLDSTERAYLEKKLLKTTNDTQDLLTNLLHWSKNQMDGSKVKLQELNLLNIIQNTINVSKELANHKNIKLNINIEDDLNIYADENMIELIVRNIVSNAIKFTANNGTIILTAINDKNKTKITIRDNGIGMHKSTLAVLFDADNRTTLGTQNEKGTGLGLLLCKEFTDLQGGQIYVSSEANKGTQVELLFPNKL